MGELRGRIVDAVTGRVLEARVHVLASSGEFAAPPSALLKVGGGPAFFYSDGTFAVEVQTGQTDIVVERGTEYLPARVTLDMPPTGAVDVDIPLTRWVRMADSEMHAGNTHVHYDEKETRPKERLAADPRVEDLPVFVVSRLRRREIPYASNAFPIGRHGLTSPDHIIDVGEETRHNRGARSEGYGHLMLINIGREVEPLSRGLLVDDANPDYPPLVDACAEARRQGGLAIWCHNGTGMEAPIAAALGALDGFNLFDPYWMDPEYEIWYGLLNCGMRLPASTGSDWYVCSSNRVYVHVPGEFSYEAWLESLRAGRTFITNGPVLDFRVAGQPPANDVLALGPRRRYATVELHWSGAQPLTSLEIVGDGAVVARYENTTGRLAGTFRARIPTADLGWLAARAWGRSRDSYGHAMWAHTSPAYLAPTAGAAVRRDAARRFVKSIDASLGWVTRKGRFDSTDQRDRMLTLFREGRQTYEALAR